MKSRFRVPLLGSPAEEAARARGARPVVVVEDRSDSAAVTAALLGAHAPGAGVVTVHPTPGSVSASTLVADVLAAMGLGVERASHEHVGGLENGSRAVRAWMLADRIEYLIVLRTHLLTGRALAWLLWLRRATPVHLVLIWHSSGPIRWEGVEIGDLPHRTMPLSRLIELLPRTSDAMVDPVQDLAQVPDSAASRFLTDAETSMPTEQFARVQAEFAAARTGTCTWIAEHTSRRCAHHSMGPAPWRGERDDALAERMLGVLARRGDPRLRAVRAQRRSTEVAAWRDICGMYRLLGHLVSDSPGMQTTITRLRGAQTALGEHGIELQLPANLAYMVGYALTSTPLNTPLIETIRTRVANPVRAAAVVIGLLSGARIEELNRIPHAGFTGEELIFAPMRVRAMADVCVCVVPPIARPVIEAAHIFIRSAPEPGTHLVADGVGTRGQILADTHRVTGVTASARHAWSQGWLWQAGMLWLGYEPRPRVPSPTRRANTPTFGYSRATGEPGTVIEERVPVTEWRRPGVPGMLVEQYPGTV